jgi:hypothetical protein
MSQSSQREYLKRAYPRYAKADPREKRRMGYGLCANAGFPHFHGDDGGNPLSGAPAATFLVGHEGFSSCQYNAL